MKRNTRRGPLRKQLPSKLDPYMTQLLEMFEQKKTYPEMRAWLAGLKPTVDTSNSNLSRVVRHRIERRNHDTRVSGVMDPGKPGQEPDSACAGKPVPELKTIIEAFRKLIMDLADGAKNDPHCLKIADQLARTAIDFVSEQSKGAFKEREVSIKEQKFAEAKKTDHERALELCLEQARAFPPVLEMFAAAFAALRNALNKK